MRRLIYPIIVALAVVLAIEPRKQVLHAQCHAVEGEIQLWNGWPPWVRIESKDKGHVFGIEVDDATGKSKAMPESLFEELLTNGSLTGTFCIEMTGEETTVPYDKRPIKYLKIVGYKISQAR